MNNFFTDPDFQAKVRQAIDDANRCLQSITPLADGNHQNEFAGASFLFSESLHLPVRWVAVLPHRDDSQLWYLVAADDFRRVGSCDVEISSSSPSSPMVLRCRVGFWVHYEDIEMDRFVGRLDSESVADARGRLEEMVTGKVPETEHGKINDTDDDYREWIYELSQVVEQIEQRIQTEPKVLKDVRFNRSWAPGVFPVAESTTTYSALAADSVGERRGAETSPGFRIPSILPGSLILQQDGDGFDLVYYPAGEDVPPRLVKFGEQSVVSGKWVKDSNGVWTWSELLKSNADSILLIIGSEKFEIEIFQ